MLNRCEWCLNDELYLQYHDQEWGRPVHDDRSLFEFLILEGAQAGLSWKTVLVKRAAYRLAFENFEPSKVAQYNDQRTKELMSNPGIIRNWRKIEAAVNNAKRVLEIQKEFGSFNDYIWSFVGGKPVSNTFARLQDLPAETDESKAMSKDLKVRGFQFVGPTICYAFMQAAGLVNDHLTNCFRYKQIERMKNNP